MNTYQRKTNLRKWCSFPTVLICVYLRSSAAQKCFLQYLESTAAADGFINCSYQLNRHQSVKCRNRWRGVVDDGVDECAVFLEVTPFLLTRELLHRLFSEVSGDVAAA